MTLRESTDFIIIHCSATPPSMDIGADEIRAWHKDRGWKDIGYHRVIRRDGTIEEGRPIATVGAHARGFNGSSIGICLVGGVDDAGAADANYTKQQWAALAPLVRQLMWTGHRNTGLHMAVLGHRDLPGVNKACPCFDVPAWWGKVL